MSNSQPRTTNLLLRALPEADYALLEPHLERTSLKLGDWLYEKNKPPERVHFLEGGVASIVSEHADGDQVEVGLYGREGVSATFLILGADQTPHASMVQVGSPMSLHIAPHLFLEACEKSSALRGLLLRYVQAQNIQVALTAASNAHFALPERLARWLLMCHDRAEGDQLEITHEFMSMMLAVRRSGVTVTLHTLEGTRAIRLARGVVTITDRARLEEIAGEAYGEAEAEYRRLIGPFGRGRHGLAVVG